MSIKITKSRCLCALGCVSVLFNFLTPLFTLVCTMTDKLGEFTTARVSASGYALLGEKYYRLMDTVRSTLEAGVVWHIIFSVLALGVLVFRLVRKTSGVWYDVALVAAGVLISLIYTIFGMYGASQARLAGHNLYAVTTYAYIPLIISCVLGIAYFALYNYLDDGFALCLGSGANEVITAPSHGTEEENND